MEYLETSILVEGDELPLRTKYSAPITGARYSINCAKKNMIVQFFEKED